MPEDQFSRSHTALEQSLLTWCAQLPNPVSEAENQSSVWYPDTVGRPPLGHDRGAKTKALWNGKAYEIVPIVEPEPDPAQRAIDEFIARRKAKRDGVKPIVPDPGVPDPTYRKDMYALDRAMKKGTP